MSTEKNVATIRAHALSLPESAEDFPWGQPAYKVRGKAFVFLKATKSGLTITLKLPESRYLATELPFAEPTGYGLGPSGWVTASFGPEEEPPFDLLFDWIEESFAAVAPKKVVSAWRG